ncbi:AAEL012863-PA [Aedes aegypti]|uniref:AAEL012863-PA n=1 Tax=Aedes aegypti TaxID=7159 RepID=Q16KV1_AEDAE|nr:AAEL012863-PA [Aedes aegypti]
MGSWNRPSGIEWPRVWIRFQARDVDSDRMVEYRVQDLPEDRVRDAIDHMKKHFLRDEPMCGSVGLYKDADALEEFDLLWQDVARQRVAVVCFREGSDEIVGLNMLTVVSKADSKDLKFKSSALQTVCDSYIGLLKQANIFEKYGIENYLSAWGLSVSPKYRGRGVGTELLRARIPMCRAMGLTVTVTLFSNPGSQIPAAKVGFYDEIVVTYKELEEQGYHFPGVPYELNKLMTMVVE